MLPGIGIFGTGPVAKCLMPILMHAGFPVEAVWGRTKDLAQSTAKEMGVTFSTSKVDEVLLHTNVDLVIISCPPHMQSPIALKALGIGKHVICTSPTGPRSVDVFKMLSASQYYPTLMSIVSYCLRHAPNYRKMKQLIEEGYVGDVHAFEVQVHCGRKSLEKKYDWSCDKKMGGGMLNTHGSAIIDLITYLTNRRATQVNGLLKTYTKETELIGGIREITSDDFCSFQMELKDDIYVSATLNNHMPHQLSYAVICCGSEGRLIGRGAELYGQKFYMTKEDCIVSSPLNKPTIPNDLFSRDPVILCDNNYSAIRDNISLDSELSEAHYLGLVELVDSLKQAFNMVEERHGYSQEPVCSCATFEESLYVQSVVDAIVKSSSERQWSKVNVINEEPLTNPNMSISTRRSTFSM